MFLDFVEQLLGRVNLVHFLDFLHSQLQKLFEVLVLQLVHSRKTKFDCFSFELVLFELLGIGRLEL